MKLTNLEEQKMALLVFFFAQQPPPQCKQTTSTKKPARKRNREEDEVDKKKEEKRKIQARSLQTSTRNPRLFLFSFRMIDVPVSPSLSHFCVYTSPSQKTTK